ncbi:MAG: hypothetical protein OSB63_05525, partial [Planctomycetota bacterium]|nr:hypothetical protein [Planctomycetota bacterium]
MIILFISASACADKEPKPKTGGILDVGTPAGDLSEGGRTAGHQALLDEALRAEAAGEQLNHRQKWLLDNDETPEPADTISSLRDRMESIKVEKKESFWSTANTLEERQQKIEK